MGLWDAVSDVGKGIGRLADMPRHVGWRALQTGYKSANFFTDIAQEAVYDHGLPIPFTDIGKGKELSVGPLKISDDEWENGIWGAVYGSVNDNVLGEGGALAKALGPRGVGGEIIRAFPEWFLRDQARGPVQAGAKGIDVIYRYGIQRGLGTPLTLASIAQARAGGGFLSWDELQTWLDGDAWQKAYEIQKKRTIGQAIAHALMTADIEDPEQVAATELTPGFNVLSGALDLKAVFKADPTKALRPVVRGVRLKYGAKGAMLHTKAQTRGRWDPRGEGGMFGPEGVVGARYKISPAEFVETPRVQRVLDIIDEHAADLDFSSQHNLGFNGPTPPPLSMAETLRRMPSERGDLLIPEGTLSPDGVKVQTLVGKLTADKRLSRLQGWTPELAQALAIAPDNVTRKFVFRLAMGDIVAREAVENAMRIWAESQTSGNTFRTIREFQDTLGALADEAKGPLRLAKEADKKQFDEAKLVDDAAVRTDYTEAVDAVGDMLWGRRNALESGMNGAAQQAIKELIELNPANAGSLFQVAYAMGHNQMGLLARFPEDTLRAHVPTNVLDAAGDPTLLTAANDFVLAGLFTEAPGINRTLFSSLAEAPAIAVRRELGHSVMNVVEPVALGSVHLGSKARRVIEVTREIIPDHIMDFRNVDQSFKNWQGMVREAAGVENGEVLRLAMKKLKIEGDANTLVGMWQVKTLSQRKKFFYDLRDAMAETYVKNFSDKIDPKLLARAEEFAKKEGLPVPTYVNYLLHNIKTRISDAEDLLKEKAVKARRFSTGDGVIIDGQSSLGVSYRRNMGLTPAHLEESAVIPRYAHIKNLEPKSALTNGARFVNGWADLVMAGWKKAVLLRPGWPLRVLSDEELRAISTVGLESQLAGFKTGLVDYRTELTRRRGIDIVAPAIDEMRSRVQQNFDELPAGLRGTLDEINEGLVESGQRAISDEDLLRWAKMDDAWNLTPEARRAAGFVDDNAPAMRRRWDEASPEDLRHFQSPEYVDELLGRVERGDAVFPTQWEAQVRVKKFLNINIGDLSDVDVFQMLGPEIVDEIFEATAKKLLKESNLTRTKKWGLAGGILAGPAGALAAAGLYTRSARKTVQTAAIREASEYFAFQMREVSVQQLAGFIDDIKDQVVAGRLSPEAAAAEITDLRYVTDLLETRAATLEEAMDLLHPRMSEDYEKLLTNFDRTGLLMQDAGYQGFMLGPHGAKNVFGNDPFEIDMSRKAASSDGGRRALVQNVAGQRAAALAEEYGAPHAYQVFEFNVADHRSTFAAKWDDTVNKQWTPTGGVGVDEWVGNFQTYIKNLWRLSDDEMIAWLEAQRGTEFASAFAHHYDNVDSLSEWVRATRLETDSILPRLDQGQWDSGFIPKPRAQDAFNVLRERASRGEKLSWNKDVLPELRRIQAESGDSLFGNELASVDEVIRKIAKGTESNFGKIVSHSGVGQDLATAGNTARLTRWVDNTMAKLGTASVDHLSRNPLWKALYETHGARRVQPYRNADGSYSLTRRQHADAMQAAKREALKEMRDLLYELGKKTRFQEMVGNLSPFFGAYQEVISKWAGIAVRNPVFVARGVRYYELATDEDNRIHLDFTGWAENDVVGKAMGKGIPYMGWMHPLLENQVVTMNPGSIMIWNAAPGLNPGANWLLGELSIANPEIGEMVQFFQPYGASEANTAWRRALENAEPTILRRLPLEGSTNYDKMVGLVAQDLLGQYIENGAFINAENFDSIGYEFTKEVKSRVKRIMMVHAIAGASLPVSVAITSPDYKLIEAYRKVQSAVGFEKAVIWLLNTHPEYWHITRRRTQLREGVAAVTREGSRRKEQHEDFANKNPKVGDFVLGEIGATDTTSTFSYFAYTAAIAQGHLERLDALETFQTTATSVGWVEFNARMEPIERELLRKFENGETRSMSFNAKGNETQREERNAVINELKRKYPYWFNDYDSSGGQQVIRGVLVSFTDMVNNHAADFMYRPELPSIYEYLEKRWEIQEELKSRPNTSLRNSDNIDLYNEWIDAHIKWGRNPTFNAVLRRYFNNDFITPGSWIGTRPKGLG